MDLGIQKAVLDYARSVIPALLQGHRAIHLPGIDPP
jgi:hypothetical protein